MAHCISPSGFGPGLPVKLSQPQLPSADRVGTLLAAQPLNLSLRIVGPVLCDTVLLAVTECCADDGVVMEGNTCQFKHPVLAVLRLVRRKHRIHPGCVHHVATAYES